MNTTTKNIELVNQYFKYFNDHDWENMANMYVENADFKDPSLGFSTVKRDRKQIVEKYRELNDMFPDIQDTVIKIYPSGDETVVVEFVSSGTAPDGTKFKLAICTIFVFNKGLITKDFTYYDDF